MVIKLVVFDMDGVLIHEHCYASKLFKDIYGIPEDEFYQVMKDNKMSEKTKDKGPNFKLFENLLEKYNVEITEEKFWNIWLDNFEFDQRVVDLALSIKESGKKIGILSDNPFERVEYFRENLEWVKEFDYVLFSSDFGVTKENPKLFEKLIEISGVKPEEIFFTDDDPENVEVAKSVGINSEPYTDLKALKSKLVELGIEVD